MTTVTPGNAGDASAAEDLITHLLDTDTDADRDPDAEWARAVRWWRRTG